MQIITDYKLAGCHQRNDYCKDKVRESFIIKYTKQTNKQINKRMKSTFTNNSVARKSTNEYKMNRNIPWTNTYTNNNNNNSNSNNNNGHHFRKMYTILT